MKCPNSSQNEIKCQILLDSAEKIIEEQGLMSFRFSDIAKVANCSSGAVYKFFESKEDVLVCLFLRSATSNNIPDMLKENSQLTTIERMLIPIIITYETIRKSKSFFALRSVSVNSKVWQLASCEKVDKFKSRCNMFFNFIHDFAIESKQKGELLESDERVLLMAKLIYFQLYGLCTAYESQLIERIDENRRSEVEVEGILHVLNGFNWQSKVTPEQFERCRVIVHEFMGKRKATKLSCAQCHKFWSENR